MLCGKNVVNDRGGAAMPYIRRDSEIVGAIR